MIEKIKRYFLDIATRIPIYRLIPTPKHRDYAAVQYFKRVAPSQIPAYLSETGRTPNWRYTAMEVAASAAFNAGDDNAARAIALEAIGSNPEKQAPRLLLSKLDSFHGDYAAAFGHAQAAWMMNPASLASALASVRLAYLSQNQEEADRIALLALRRFPLREKMLWAVCKHCRSHEQFTRIHQLWSAKSKKVHQVSEAARPLGLAAVHLGLYKVAMELYAEACLIELQGLGIGRKLPLKALAGKRVLSVLRDLREVLEADGIPFFFAAGTALGIVRNGRPLDHDDDIDVGVFEEHWDRDRLLAAFMRHPHFDLEASSSERPKIRLLHRGGAGIDIFRFYREGDGVYHDGNFVRWKNSTFQIEAHNAAGGTVYLPTDTDRYLTENYGDWRTPDKGFDAFIDGPNVEVTIPEYHNIHRMRRAYRFIRAMNMIDVYRELMLLKEPLAQSEAGRGLIREMQL